MKLGYQDWFGFLSVSHNFEIKDVRVELISNFKDSNENVKKSINKDGFFYPPITYKKRGTYKGKGKRSHRNSYEWNKIPQTERPAHLYQLPPSHRVIIKNVSTNSEPRKMDAALIIFLLSYLYGTQLQFYDWWFDQRIPIKSQHRIGFDHNKAEDFLTSSYRSWSQFETGLRMQVINILYMNSRSLSYEWEWERFIIDYMVFDAVFNFCCKRYGWNSRSIKHKERLVKLCQFYNLFYDEQVLKEIYNLRNELFHEALWDNKLPSREFSMIGFKSSIALRQLNQRLIVAIFDYQTTYLQTRWPITLECIF